MTAIVALANLKGGVGKTTLTLHLAHEAASRGLKVLAWAMPAGILAAAFSDAIQQRRNETSE